MKWSVEKKDNEVYVTINGRRAVNNEGIETFINSARIGNTKNEIWMKFNGDKKGKMFDRTFFESGNSGRLSQKFICANSNTEFLQVLEKEGVCIERRMERKGTQRSVTKTDQPKPCEPVPGPNVPDYDQLKIIHEKYRGRMQIPIEHLFEAPGQLWLREINGKWVNTIKNSLMQDPGSVTIISVCTDPTVKDSEVQSYNVLGGNHFIKAVKQLFTEEPNNDNYQCLRMIQADVYDGLSIQESLVLAARHNNMTNERRLVFQDKVRLARKAYESSDKEWKKQAIAVISCLDGKMESMGTILSVAGYASDNWLITQEIFSQYESGATRECPFPQNLFRQLQGISDEKRTPSKAIGTNGLKVAQMVIIDKRRETLKTLTVQILKAENWDKVCDKHEGAEEFLSFTGNVSTAEGRERFSKFIETTTTKEKSNTYISIKIFNNSEEITDRIKEIAKNSVLIEKELKQTIFIEE